MNTEDLAYWYFRLNGFFTITNFVVHPQNGGTERTEVDIFGVRFPHRAEFPACQSGSDDKEFMRISNKPYAVIAEVKKRTCRLNGPWTNPKSENLQEVLKDLGLFHEKKLDQVVDALYEIGVYEDESFYCSLFCMGDRRNTKLGNEYPKVPQKTWDEVLHFIYKRFRNYKNRKKRHQQWNEVGKELWKFCQHAEDISEFITAVRNECGLSTSNE